jgi:quercetin 2,3-dioxygenase
MKPQTTAQILHRDSLGFQWPTSDPYLFCVHHLDYYPEGNGKFGPKASLQGRDIGQDFAGKDGWRMYHGSHIPGFPGHPHRGFETITIVEQGLVDHADSFGAAGRYGDGDVQWMTAGSGIQHSEMFPLVKEDKPNTAELFQIWLNLPSQNKMVEPHFTMFWNEKIPRVTIADEKGNKSTIKVIAGTLFGKIALTPPPNSWAADSKNEVGIYIINLSPMAEFRLPASPVLTNRNFYHYSSTNLLVGEEESKGRTMFAIDSGQDLIIRNGSEPSSILVLEGRPIAEKVVQYGPFVMNSQNEIQQAFSDYQRTQFGGWPWPSYDPVHTGSLGSPSFPMGKNQYPNRLILHEKKQNLSNFEP